MSTNKHAILRYRTIDRCLRDRNGSWNWKSLAEECSREIWRSTGKEVSLSERTIKGDIAVMRSNELLGYFAPIEYDRKEKSYYYTDVNYSLLESPINKTDKRDLEQALSVLRQFSGFKQLLGIQNIITKMQHFIDHRKSNPDVVIHFDHPLDATGQEWLPVLYQGIRSSQCLNLTYRPFGREQTAYLVSPYLLKEYQKRWYLIGYVHGKRALRTFALDRIRDIRSSFAEFHEEENFDSQRYFNDIVGITLDKSQPVEEIEFEAYGIQVNYFETRPIHSSQQVVFKKTDLARFKIQVMINYELISEIFSYRDKIRVISPPHLVDELKKESQKMATLYD